MKNLSFIVVCLFTFKLFAGTRIGVINDLNGIVGNPFYSLSVSRGLENLIKTSPDLVIAPGDLIAGQDPTQILPIDYFKGLWMSFDFVVLSKLKLAKIPFAPAPGNHDANASLLKEVKAYGEFFKLKSNIPKVNFIDKRKYPYYYSYMKDNVFFIALDDTKIGKLWDNNIEGLSQKEWIRDQLHSLQAMGATARIVYGHIPLYSVLNKSQHEKKFSEVLDKEQFNVNKSDTLENILIEGNVDLTVFGHSHAFYPGIVQHKDAKRGLNILFSPCLGSKPRTLYGQSDVQSKKAYSIIDVTDDGQVSYSVYDFNGLLINSKNLPKKISSNKNVSIKRDDNFYRNRN